MNLNVLHVIATPRFEESVALQQLAQRFMGPLVARCAEKGVELVPENVSLYESKPPFVSNEFLGGAWRPAMEPGYTPTRNEEIALNFARNNAPLLARADVVVLTTPIWLGSCPAILKAWLDQVMIPGDLFEMTAEGIVPKHHIREVVLLVSSREVYKEGDPRDGLSPMLRAAFLTIGVENVRIAWADGQDDARADKEDRLDLAGEAAEEIAEEIVDEL